MFEKELTKESINVGDQATVSGETRTVIDLKRNTEGGIVVVWSAAGKQTGGCVPSVWAEWAEGLDQKRRR